MEVGGIAQQVWLMCAAQSKTAESLNALCNRILKSCCPNGDLDRRARSHSSRTSIVSFKRASLCLRMEGETNAGCEETLWLWWNSYSEVDERVAKLSLLKRRDRAYVILCPPIQVIQVTYSLLKN